MAFADRLEAALKVRGLEPLIDRTEIYAFEDWWKRIEQLIIRADTVVFVISPDAVGSDVCRKEVAFAASLNKRFAPIIFRRVEDKSVPDALAQLNFIFSDNESRFEENADRLAEALSTTQIGSDMRAIAGRKVMRGLQQIKQYQRVIQQQERTSIRRNAAPETGRVGADEARHAGAAQASRRCRLPLRDRLGASPPAHPACSINTASPVDAPRRARRMKDTRGFSGGDKLFSKSYPRGYPDCAHDLFGFDR